MKFFPLYVVAQTADKGIDWTAIVSAGAAVIQAVGSVAAIWFSVRIAQQAAARERAADEAATRRIREADEAAERRRIADRNAADALRSRQEREDYNRPLELAFQLGQEALAEVNEQVRLFEEKSRVAHSATEWAEALPKVAVLLARLDPLIGSAQHAKIVAVLEESRTKSAQLPQIIPLAPIILLRSYKQKANAIAEAIAQVASLIKV